MILAEEGKLDIGDSLIPRREGRGSDEASGAMGDTKNLAKCITPGLPPAPLLPAV
jgi:hypothetical protein